MGRALRVPERGEFARELARATGRSWPDRVVDGLLAHYAELARWAPRLALVGPAFEHEAVERHYAESLAGLDLIPTGAVRILDLGSGAGFPGLVLATARPDLEFVLVESRERKWAFLEAARRRIGLSARIVSGRVESVLPAEIPVPYDVVTSRAIALSPAAARAVAGGLRANGVWLGWTGPGDSFRPESWRAGSARTLAGSGARRIESWYPPEVGA